MLKLATVRSFMGHRLLCPACSEIGCTSSSCGSWPVAAPTTSSTSTSIGMYYRLVYSCVSSLWLCGVLPIPLIQLCIVICIPFSIWPLHCLFSLHLDIRLSWICTAICVGSHKIHQDMYSHHQLLESYDDTTTSPQHGCEAESSISKKS